MEVKLKELIKDFAGNGILQPNQVPLTIQDVILMHLGLCMAPLFTLMEDLLKS